MLELDKENWEAEVEKASGWVLVDFWSPSCEPCKELKPEVEALGEKYGNQMKFCALDITKARRLAIKQKVLGLPVIAFYNNGEKQGELAGDITPEEVENKIKELVG